MQDDDYNDYNCRQGYIFMTGNDYERHNHGISVITLSTDYRLISSYPLITPAGDKFTNVGSSSQLKYPP